MDLREPFANAQAALAAAQLSGGMLIIEDAEGNTLASARIGEFDEPQRGAVSAKPFKGTGLLTGTPVTFRAFDADGTELLDGTVGPAPQDGTKPPDLVLPPPLIVQYADILIDRFVYRVIGL